MKFLRHISALLLVFFLGLWLLAQPVAAQVTGGTNYTPINLLDNGAFDFYQRGTTAVTAVTTTPTYHADRWAGYANSLASSVTLTNVTSTLPARFANAERVQRAAANASTQAVCLVQEVQTSDVIALQGQQVTLSGWFIAGGNFSAASNNVSFQVPTGTGTDEGLGTLPSGWTGAATTSANQPITSTWTRYAQVFTVPATATELAAQFCYTPVGTAGASDFFQVTGVQLELGNTSSLFNRRQAEVELPRLQRYFACPVQEVNGVNPVIFGGGPVTGTTTADIWVPMPVTMRAPPSIGVSPTGALSAAGSLQLLAGSTGISISTLGGTGSKAGVNGVMLLATVSSGLSAGSNQAFVALTSGSLGTGKFCPSADF